MRKRNGLLLMLVSMATLHLFFTPKNVFQTNSKSGKIAWVSRVTLKATNSNVGGATDNNTLQHSRTESVKEICSEVKHIVMTKTSKTGSSTMFGILAKYSLRHRLKFLYPLTGHHINWNSTEEWRIGPGVSERADVLIHHAVYNQTMIDKYMMADIKRITLVREPVSWFISAINYYQHLDGAQSRFGRFKTPSEILENEEILYKRRGFPVESWFHIPQLLWSGFDYRLRDNLTAIKEHIALVVKRSDSIILTDQFDASLVILKKRFCWSYMNIFYRKYETQKSGTLFSLSPAGVKKLLSPEVNLGDQLLYAKLNETWWNQPEIKQPGFWKEVADFAFVNQNISEFWCQFIQKGRKYVTIPSTPWHGSILLDKAFCDHIATPQPQEVVRNYARYHSSIMSAVN